MNIRHGLVLSAAVGFCLLFTSALFAEDIWVKSESAEIRAGKGAVFPLIATAKKGAKLEVVSREPKGWIKVKVEDKEGYVYEKSISAEKVEGGSGNLLSAVGAGSDASAMSTGAAAKGVTESAATYAANKHLDPKLMDWLIAFRKKIDARDWQAFTAEGKVGPDAQ